MIETATLAGGCFWCTEAIFQRLTGVRSVLPGYSGGTVENPNYDQVSMGTTGHAEAIQIKYDPATISFSQLLDIFWATHDPTHINQQGHDYGPQYRSVIFHHDEEQRAKAETSKVALTKSGAYHRPIATEIVPFSEFYVAEDYHQNYYNNHSDAAYCHSVIDPKLQKLTKSFSPWLK